MLYIFVAAEYIISLGSLTFETFSNAIREKYEDLYFEEDLLVNLFDAVNGRRPVAGRRYVRSHTISHSQCCFKTLASPLACSVLGAPLAVWSANPALQLCWLLKRQNHV